MEKYAGTVEDSCPDWRTIIPERYWPAELAHLPESLAERIRGLPDDRGLFLWGPQGAGKTYANAAAAKHLWGAGFDIAWQPFEELLLRVRSTYRPGGGSELDILEPLCQVDVLCIEDVGCTVAYDRQETDFSLRTFLVLLDHRLAHCRKTFLSSNKSIEDLAHNFDTRIASRICEACDVVRIAGRDRRADRLKRKLGVQDE
ncbi:MAG: ATP-binding protein [Planctomycetes bacterium]|nr:ATP-binding protein [Planctomycetota bacterium]